MVRKDCKYSDADLTCILPYKAEFMTSTTHERIIILRKKILPSMFNHWMENRKEYDPAESKVLSKVLLFIFSVIRLLKRRKGTYAMVFQQLAYDTWPRKTFKNLDKVHRCALEDETQISGG